MLTLHPGLLVAALVVALWSEPGLAAPDGDGIVARAMPQPPVSPVSLAPGLVADGQRLVLSWLDREGGGHALRFSEFDGRRWSPAGRIASGTNWFANWADTPAIHISANGDWFAHWLQKSAPATYAYDLRISRSADRGQSWSPPYTPHRDKTPSEHGFASYFDHAGTTFMVWLDGRRTAADPPGPMTLRTAALTTTGGARPSTLLDARVCDCCATASAVTEHGPVVVYRDRSENEIRDIRLVRLETGGWSEPVPVHDDGWQIAGCPVNGPDVIASESTVVVAWFTMADDVPAVRVAVSSDSGQSFGPPVTLSPGHALGRVRLAWHRDQFVLGWMAGDPEGGESGAEYRLARFSAGGTLLGQRPAAALAAGRISGFPEMAVLGDTLYLAWTGSMPAADGRGAPRIRVARIALESIPSG